MKKSVIALLHIGFWACYFILIAMVLGIVSQTGAVEKSQIEIYIRGIFLFAIVPSAISFYSFYFFLFPKYVQDKKILPTIGCGLFISLFSAIIGYVLSITLCEAGSEDDSFIGAIIFLMFVTSITGFIAIIIRGFITWFEEIKLKESLKQKNHEMEMALVKAQLDPHFLFNTINNIDVLILKNANDASNYLNKLSDIMRFMLFETKTDEILLSKEIEYIEKYIALQKIRTSNSNYINYKVLGKPNSRTIAPMVFVPFIENAFKHTTNKKIDNAINVSIIIESDNIKLICENKFDPNRKLKKDANGLGNDLIQKRLNLIYPNRHKLEITNKGNLHSVSLIINNNNG